VYANAFYSRLFSMAYHFPKSCASQRQSIGAYSNHRNKQDKHNGVGQMQYKWFGLKTEIDSSTQYATVYDVKTDRPVATFTRARVLSRDKFEWSVHDTNGNLMCQSNRILEGLRALKTVQAGVASLGHDYYLDAPVA
jgi:hypothetical protein